MSDIFGTQNSKATQAVIDAASKILIEQDSISWQNFHQAKR